MSIRGFATLLLCGNPYLLNNSKLLDMQVTTTKSRTVGKFVDSKHTDNVIRNYKQERWVQNSKHIGKEDSLSAWYSVEELERFLAIIKEHGADGVRMYFGAYDADYAEVPLYAGRQTIVMVATQGKDDLDKTLVQSYANTGVVHIIAISGLHLGLVYWLLATLLNPIANYTKMKWIKPLGVIAGLWLFSLLAGLRHFRH